MVSKENIKKNQYYQYRQLPIKDLLFVIVFFFLMFCYLILTLLGQIASNLAIFSQKCILIEKCIRLPK